MQRKRENNALKGGRALLAYVKGVGPYLVERPTTICKVTCHALLHIDFTCNTSSSKGISH